MLREKIQHDYDVLLTAEQALEHIEGEIHRMREHVSNLNQNSKYIYQDFPEMMAVDCNSMIAKLNQLREICYSFKW